MPEEDANGEGADPGPIETGGVLSAGCADPGPIETDHVMKNLIPLADDPMAGRDLHVDEILGDDAGSAE